MDPAPRPLAQLSGPVAALWSDLDGTLTTGGRLEPETYASVAAVAAAGVSVVVVTGRSAGWGHALATVAPVAAVIAENGGVTFTRDDRGLLRELALAPVDLLEWRRRMHHALDLARFEVPGIQLSSDSAYREVDLAVDWNEEAALSPDDADRVVGVLQAQGLAASRSNVHVNLAPPLFDKGTACQALIRRRFPGLPRASHVFVGDSVNDAPAFALFPNSVGVANIRDCWGELPARPAFVTEAAEGAGFREVAAHILSMRR